MAAKNKPIYEFFCKGMMNRKHKGIRFDENGNVVCEPNAEFGADVEVDGKLRINSAKDLVTKDGTSFGGGGLPSPWVANENVLGYEDTENQVVIGFLVEGGNLYGYQNKQAGEVSYVSPVASGSPNIFVYLNVNTQVESSVLLPDDFMTKSQEINLGDINTNKAEIAKKQATLYRHTIDIAAGGLGLHTYVTALSEKNTVIDSIQDLVTVFGNTKLMATGAHGTDNEATVLLEVGTSLTDTYVHTNHGTKMSLSNWANYGPDENYLVITDSVTAV